VTEIGIRDFSEGTKWTQDWKDTVLAAIERKREHLYDNHSCQCCDKADVELEQQGPQGATRVCRICPLGESLGICWQFMNIRNCGGTEEELLEFLDLLKAKTEARLVEP